MADSAQEGSKWKRAIKRFNVDRPLWEAKGAKNRKSNNCGAAASDPLSEDRSITAKTSLQGEAHKTQKQRGKASKSDTFLLESGDSASGRYSIASEPQKK